MTFLTELNKARKIAGLPLVEATVVEAVDGSLEELKAQLKGSEILNWPKPVLAIEWKDGGMFISKGSKWNVMTVKVGAGGLTGSDNTKQFDSMAEVVEFASKNSKA